MKRIFLLICVLLSVSMFSVYAENGYDEEKTAVEYLQTLKIFEDISSDTYSDYVTREDFAYYIAKMQGLTGSSKYRYFRDIQKDSYAFAYISDLVEKGIISASETETFRPLEYITPNEATKMIVASLGYDKYAQFSGGYPKGYLKIANDFDIYSSKSRYLTFTDSARMIYDALQCHTYKVNGSIGQNMQFSEGSTTLMEDVFNIKTDEGIVTDTEFGSILNDEPLDESYIVISDKNYAISENFDDKDYLGMYVKYFYNADDEKIIYMCCNNRRQSDKCINIDDYEEFLNDSITYYEGNKLKKISMSEQPVIVYNGLPLRTKIDNTMKNLNKGKLVFRDSNNDSKFDLVLVEDYKNFYVAAIEPNTKILYNGLEEKNEINIGNAEKTIIHKGQNKVEFKNIDVGMSLSVAASQNGKIIQILINTDTIIGNFNGFDGETVSINNEKYNIDKSYIQEFNGEFSLGTELTCTVDRFGYVVYAIDKENIWTLGYMIRSFIDDENGDMLKLKLLSEDNKITTFDFAKRVTIDGQNYKKTEDIETVIKSIMQNNKLIQYKLNSNNEIVCLDSIINSGNEEPKHSLAKCFDEVKSRFYMSDGVERYGHTAYFTSDTVIFYIPQDASELDDYYVRKGTLNSIGNVMVTLDGYYSGEDRSYVNAVVLQRDNTPSERFSLMMVENVALTLNKDSDEIYKVEGYVNGAKTSYEIEKKFDCIAECNRGDMIVIKRDNSTNTEIVEVLKIYDAQTGELNNFALSEPMYVFYSGVNTIVGDYCETYNIAFGSVQRVFQSGLVSIGKNPGGNETDRVIFQGKTCIIYDTKTNTISKGTFNDMLDYRTTGYDCSKVMYNTHWDDVQSAFIFR